MKRLNLDDFKNKKLDQQQEAKTKKVLDQVLGTGPKRPRHCPMTGFTGGTIC